MCGVAGYLGFAPIGDAELAAIGASLDHRGPDGRGIWRNSGSPAVALLHRRLAIQDLSSAGQQPMLSACGGYALVFNGEIYNQHDLRRELERQGHTFRSTSDTEVLLQLYIRYGTAALQRLQGMYAFCLWDRREQRALLARDPFGIKPLYLWQGRQGQLLFASEVRALLASGLIPRQLHRPALAAFLASGSVPEPLTLVEGITSLPPGHLGVWQRGQWQVQAHWQPTFAPGLPLPADQHGNLTRQALAASVQAHQLSDVPVGLFLSGGLDSATLLALADRPLTTLSIGFRERAFDESGVAAALAHRFGSRHVGMELDPQAAAALLPGFLAAVDQPTVDGFNTYSVAHLARQQGLKVVLSGLGGDELFGGYPSFRRIPQLLHWHRRLGSLRRPLARRLGRHPRHHCQRLAAFLGGPGTAAAAHTCLRGLFAPREIRALLGHWQLDWQLGTGPCESAGLALEQGLEAQVSSQADAVAWLETSRYMGQQLLRDSDVFSMAHGLELRLPFVDAALFRRLAVLPATSRLAPNKALLRQAVPELQALLPAGRKQGFVVPFQTWLDQPESVFVPGGGALSRPSIPAGLDLSPWARRWGLIVLRDWLHRHLQLELG